MWYFGSPYILALFIAAPLVAFSVHLLAHTPLPQSCFAVGSGVSLLGLLSVWLVKLFYRVRYRILGKRIIRERLWHHQEWIVKKSYDEIVVVLEEYNQSPGGGSKRTGPHMMWGVDLSIDGATIRLERSRGARLEARLVGKALVRALGISMSYRGIPDIPKVSIAAKDLDLPFTKRIERYPSLRIRPCEKPMDPPFKEDNLPGGGVRFCWAYNGWLSRALLLAQSAFWIIAVFVYDSHAHWHWPTGVLASLLLLIVGLRTELTGGPEGVGCQHLLFGLPLVKRFILGTELEELILYRQSLASYSEMVSDRTIITCGGMLFVPGDTEGGQRWLAWRIQEALRGASNAPGGIF